MSTGPGQSSGKFLAMRLEILIAELSDPQRLRRGRDYQRQGAVNELHVTCGEIMGMIYGSQRTPYSVSILAAPVDANESELIPSRRELSFHCSCPDSDRPCKHVVAVFLEFCHRVANDTDVLRSWRVASQQDQPRARVGSRATAPGDPSSGGGQHSLDAAMLAELGEFLGTDLAAMEFHLGGCDTSRLASDEAWQVMLADALRVISHPSSRQT